LQEVTVLNSTLRLFLYAVAAVGIGVPLVGIAFVGLALIGF